MTTTDADVMATDDDNDAFIHTPCPKISDTPTDKLM